MLRIPDVRPLATVVLPAVVLVIAGALAVPALAAKPKKPPAEEATTVPDKPAASASKKSSRKGEAAPAAAKDKAPAKASAGKSSAAKSAKSVPKDTASAPKRPAPAPAPSAQHPAPAPSAPAAPQVGGIQRLSFPVRGMVCMLCTRGVEEAIKRLPGVATVTADLGSGRVDVVAQERHSLDIQQVRERAGRAGFPVSGEVDVQAAGRFEIGVDRRLTFKPFGGVYAWQVLESARLLALSRARPGLRGDFVIGLRLHDKPSSRHPSIDITSFDPDAPVQRAAGGA